MIPSFYELKVAADRMIILRTVSLFVFLNFLNFSMKHETAFENVCQLMHKQTQNNKKFLLYYMNDNVQDFQPQSALFIYLFDHLSHNISVS